MEIKTTETKKSYFVSINFLLSVQTLNECQGKDMLICR